ncbi:MAG TPA: hypothetical protein VKD72_14760 [Gemmataceae bacterium]|nr:hypothetical protein [Gemmataceae bacterium]
MTTPSGSEPLRQAMTRGDAARSAGPPAPCDLYVFHLDVEVAPVWLVVRAHPDDSHLLLAVPVDDFPLAGPPDVLLPQGRTARCGQALWLPAGHLLPPLQTGLASEEVVRLVRRKVAELARGQVVATEEQVNTDHDPAYEGWLAAVEQARRRLQERVSEAKPLLRLAELSPDLPPELISATREDATTTDVTTSARYLELCIGTGKLFLLADVRGVRALWSGPAAEAPALTGELGSGQLRAVTWQRGQEDRLQRAEPLFPWVEGRVVLALCTDPPQALTIQR